ncbi:MAG: Type secretion system effector, Hcp [Gaiellaceae bacterium]|nr:Type secretion system effector, Hcp [Gaiellaceae bacterium]
MGEHRRRHLAIAVAVVAGVLVTGGGLALAEKSKKPIPIGADGTITACAKLPEGRLRMVGKPKECQKREQVVTWNQKGAGTGGGTPGDVVVGTLTLGSTTVSLHAFSFGATGEIVTSGGGGSGAGKVKVADIEVLKDVDGLTMDSTEGVFTGKHYPTIAIVLFNPGTTTVRATYTFSDVLFTGTQQFSAGALERVTFHYDKIKLVIGSRTFSFDVSANKKL